MGKTDLPYLPISLSISIQPTGRFTMVYHPVGPLPIPPTGPSRIATHMALPNHLLLHVAYLHGKIAFIDIQPRWHIQCLSHCIPPIYPASSEWLWSIYIP